jgi:endonuclease/exonuclease/phosphatase family metal-dependent hydrolase
MDNRGATSRLESLKLIWDKVEELNTQKYPVLVMGDFNAVPDSPPIAFLSKHMNDTRNSSQTTPSGPIGTYNGFDTSHPLDERIDYIFASDDVEVHSYQVINAIQNNRTPSDHLPVIIDFEISSSQ